MKAVINRKADDPNQGAGPITIEGFDSHEIFDGSLVLSKGEGEDKQIVGSYKIEDHGDITIDGEPLEVECDATAEGEEAGGEKAKENEEDDDESTNIV